MSDEYVHDKAYLEGMRAGFSMGQMNDVAAYEARKRSLCRELGLIRNEEAPHLRQSDELDTTDQVDDNKR